MNIQKKIDKYLNEGKFDYIIYHDTYTSAVKSMMDFIKKNGYYTNEDDIFTKITTGPGKPKKGKTNKVHLDLYKNGKLQRKKLHAQVYNRGVSGNTYELNMYIK